jgi:hypothetical protein
MPVNHISNGQLLIQDQDENWYYLDILVTEGAPFLQVPQAPITGITEGEFLGYITMRDSEGNYRNLSLRSFEGDVFYEVGDPLDVPIPATRLFLKASNTGGVYEVILVEGDEDEITIGIKDLITGVITIQSPFKELYTMSVLGRYDVVIPASLSI